jgi:hypothetical protein
MGPTETLFWLGLASGVAALTMTETDLALAIRSRLGDGWLAKLFGCSYCMAHWTSAITVAFVPVPGVHWLFPGWFAVTAVAALFCWVALMSTALISALREGE